MCWLCCRRHRRTGSGRAAARRVRHALPARPAPARSVLLCARVRVVLLAWQHCAKACVYCTHCAVTNVVARIIYRRAQSVYANLSINTAMWCGLVAGVVRKIFTCAGLGSSAFFCVLLGMGYVTSSQGAVVCTFGACCCSYYTRLLITRVHYCWRIVVVLTETGSGSACGRVISSNISVLSVLSVSGNIIRCIYRGKCVHRACERRRLRGEPS